MGGEESHCPEVGVVAQCHSAIGPDELSLSQTFPSLRANGSRECAPDDRLREAIQSRNQDWIASSRSLSSGQPKARAACASPLQQRRWRVVLITLPTRAYAP